MQKYLGERLDAALLNRITEDFCNQLLDKGYIVNHRGVYHPIYPNLSFSVAPKIEENNPFTIDLGLKVHYTSGCDVISVDCIRQLAKPISYIKGECLVHAELAGCYLFDEYVYGSEDYHHMLAGYADSEKMGAKYMLPIWDYKNLQIIYNDIFSVL